MANYYDFHVDFLFVKFLCLIPFRSHGFEAKWMDTSLHSRVYSAAKAMRCLQHLQHTQSASQENAKQGVYIYNV